MFKMLILSDSTELVGPRTRPQGGMRSAPPCLTHSRSSKHTFFNFGSTPEHDNETALEWVCGRDFGRAFVLNSEPDPLERVPGPTTAGKRPKEARAPGPGLGGFSHADPLQSRSPGPSQEGWVFWLIELPSQDAVGEAEAQS